MSSSNHGAEVYATASLKGELYRGGAAGEPVHRGSAAAVAEPQQQQIGVRYVAHSAHAGSQPGVTEYQTEVMMSGGGQSQHIVGERTGAGTTCTTTEMSRQSYAGGERLAESAGAAGGEQRTVESVRKISSIVLESTPLGEVPKDTETYIDVPKYEEEIIYVPVKEVKEIVRNVPVYDVVYVDREVVVPRQKEVVEWVDTPNYVVKEIPEYYDEPAQPQRPTYKDVYVKVPVKGKTVYKDREVEQPEEVVVQRFLDHEVPVIVAQTAKPTIPDATEKRVVQAQDFQPEITFVDVHLTRPVDRTLELVGVQSSHKLVNLDAAHYNTLLRKLNAGQTYELPYVVENGRREFVADSEISMMIAPPGTVIEGWTPKPKSGYAGRPQSSAAAPASTAAGVETASGAFEGSAVLLRGAATERARLATSAAPPQSLVSSAARHSLKTREAEQPPASDNSSVSSSINKIASEINMGRKKNAMCCGSRSGATGAGTVQLTYPNTAVASVSTERQRAEIPEYQSLHTSPQQLSHNTSTYSKSFRPIQVRARAC